MERIEDPPDLPVHEDHSYSVGSNVGFNHDHIYSQSKSSSLPKFRGTDELEKNPSN